MPCILALLFQESRHIYVHICAHMTGSSTLDNVTSPIRCNVASLGIKHVWQTRVATFCGNSLMPLMLGLAADLWAVFFQF